MRWICAYDIADSARRRQVAEQLEAIGIRVQRSVFECDLEAGQWRVLRTQILELLDEQEDCVLWCPQNRWGTADRQVFGYQYDEFVLSTAYVFDQ